MAFKEYRESSGLTEINEMALEGWIVVSASLREEKYETWNEQMQTNNTLTKKEWVALMERERQPEPRHI